MREKIFELIADKLKPYGVDSLDVAELTEEIVNQVVIPILKEASK